MSELSVVVDDIELSAQWTQSNQDLIAQLTRHLPLSGMAHKWGDELYFTVPIEASPRETQTIVEPGTIAYWPAGPALCLFWGPTPASTDERPAAASPVAPVGVLDSIEPLSTITGNAHVTIQQK